MELGVFLKEAMLAAGGVPFADLPPEALCAALRKYETVRSERAALIIAKSRYIGSLSNKRPFLVCLMNSPCSLPAGQSPPCLCFSLCRRSLQRLCGLLELYMCLQKAAR